MKKITFCEQNFELGAKEVMDRLTRLKLNNYDVRSTRCLGECGECFSSCIADFHGKLLVEETPEKLYEKILELINQ